MPRNERLAGRGGVSICFGPAYGMRPSCGTSLAEYNQSNQWQPLGTDGEVERYG